MPFVLLHEINERNLMAKGMSYEKLIKIQVILNIFAEKT